MQTQKARHLCNSVQYTRYTNTYSWMKKYINNSPFALLYFVASFGWRMFYRAEGVCEEKENMEELFADGDL